MVDIPTQGPTLIDQTYASLLNAICNGRLEPGMRLNQDELAARMQVSRQPVGQALSILKTQGFVRDAGRRGLIVAPLERAFFRAIYQLREAIDPMAARLAAEQAARADLAEGRRLLAAGRDAVKAAAIDGLIACDMAFHLWIYRLSGNPLMLETMRLYWNHLRRAMGEVLRPTATRQQVWDEHESILQALAERDAEAAGRRSLEHVKGAAQRVADSIPDGRPQL